MAKLAASGTLRVGIKYDAPGFSQKTLDGTYVGLNVEISEMIAGALGIPKDKIQWVDTVSANRVPFLQQGKVDLVAANLSIDPERAKAVTFVGPIVQSYDAVMVLAGNPANIKTWDDLNGKSLCGVSGGSGPDEAKAKAPQVKIVGFDSQAKCATALSNHQVDAVISSSTSLYGLMGQSPGDYELTSLKAGGEDLALAVPKGQLDFCGFIQTVLKNAVSSGAYQAAWDNTLGKIVPGPAQPLDFIACS